MMDEDDSIVRLVQNVRQEAQRRAMESRNRISVADNSTLDCIMDEMMREDDDAGWLLKKTREVVQRRSSKMWEDDSAASAEKPNSTTNRNILKKWSRKKVYESRFSNR